MTRRYQRHRVLAIRVVCRMTIALCLHLTSRAVNSAADIVVASRMLTFNSTQQLVNSIQGKQKLGAAHGDPEFSKVAGTGFEPATSGL